MKKDLYIGGVRYLTAREAGDVLGYAPDYISRLCREGRLRGRRSGKSWIVEADSLVPFLKEHEARKQAWHQDLSRELKSVGDLPSVTESDFVPLPRSHVAPRELHILRRAEHAKIAREEARVQKIISTTASSALVVLALFVITAAMLSSNLTSGVREGQIAGASFFSPFESAARATYASINSFACSITDWCGEAQPLPVVYVRAPGSDVATAEPAPVQNITNNITNYIQPNVGGGALFAGGVSEQLLDSRLNALENYLTGRIDLLALQGDRQAESLADGIVDGIGGAGFDDIDITDSTFTGGSISGAAISGSSFTGTTLSVTDATTTNLYVDGSFGFGSDTGLLQNSAGTVSTLSNGSNGQVLKMVDGALTWGTDNTGGGGGGSSFFSTTTDELAIYPADTSDVVIIGDSATTTVGNILEIAGASLFRGAITSYGVNTATRFTATSTVASVFPYASTTALSATTLCLSSDCRTSWPTDGFSTTSSDYWSTQRNFFSTTSSDYWKSVNNFFSTTSADYWETQQTARTADDLSNNSIEDLNDVAAMTENYGDLLYWNGTSWADIATSSLGLVTSSDLGSYFTLSAWYATTTDGLDEGSTNRYYTDNRVQTYLDTIGKGFFFSTTSADAWKDTRNFFSTTSSDYWKSVNNFFSTSSSDYWKTQNNFFSTTSTDFWKSANNFFSTTSADYYVHSSTTIPKTYAVNSFSALQTFANASTTILSANTICLSTDCRTSWPAAGSSFDYLFPANATSTLLGFNGGLTAYASSTIGNGTAAGGLTISGGATTTGLLHVLGTGTSTFAGNILMSGNITPSADNTYSLGSATNMWRDVYIGPGSLYVNGKKVIEDVSNTITISTDADQSLMSETSGVGNNTVRATGSGNLNLLTSSGNINITSTSGNINLGTSGSGQLNLGIIASGTWQGTTIGDNYLTKSGNWTGTLDGYEASQLLGSGFSTTSADYWKTANNFFSTTSADYWGSTKGYATFGYLFPSSATSTLLSFNGGLTAYASSTIGNGTAAGGLTVNGTATTSNLSITSLTAGRVPFASTNGRVTDSANLTFDGSTLAVTSGVVQSTSGIFRGDDQYHQIILHNGVNASDYIEWGDTLASGGGHRFYVGGATPDLRMQIATDGVYMRDSLGIGTSSPYAKLSVVGDAVAARFIATTSVASIFPYASTTALSATTLCLTGDSCIASWPTFTDTSFSTTSADAWKDTRNFFSTTSADYWETQQTARTADDLTNNSIEDLQDVAAMTENYGDLLYWNGTSWADIATSSLGLVTSSDLGAYLTLSAWYATTTDGLDEGSTNRYYTDSRVQTYLDTIGKGYFFATTSADAWKDARNFFSTTSATYFVDASTTIPKTYTANTFTALQSFSNASTTLFSSTYASATRATFGNLGVGIAVPNNKLEVSANVAGSYTNSANIAFSYSPSPTTYVNSIRNNFSGTAANHSMGFYMIQNSTETNPLTFFADGRAVFNYRPIFNSDVGINTGSNNPISALQVATATLQNVEAFSMSNTNSNYRSAFRTGYSGASLNANYATFYIDQGIDNIEREVWTAIGNGNLGIGTTSPGSKLSVAGNMFVTGNIISTSTIASIFPFASTTALSATVLCLTGDSCIASWPTFTDTSFSTTSADFWKSANNFFSTTSADYYKSVTDLFSTTSANYFAHSSTTIPKTYTANAFTAFQSFVNASSTLFSSEYASSTRGIFGGVGVGTTTPYASLAIQGSSDIRQLVVKGNSTQTNYLLDLQNSSNSSVFNISNTGVVNGRVSFSNSAIVHSNNNSNLQLGSITVSESNSKDLILTPATSGNVGIGTTSPYAKLSVVGTVVGARFVATTSVASIFPYASSTALSADTLCLTGDTCIASWPTGSSYPFSLSGNATSTLTQFNGGLTAYASSTIGNGTATGGLTISGNSTTTGNAYLAGSFGIGTTSPSKPLSVNGTALFGGGSGTTTFEHNVNVHGLLKVGTNSILLNGNGTSTFSGGIDLSTGCFAILGTCLLSGGSGLTAGDVNASVNNFVNAMQIASSSAKYVYLVDGVSDSFGSASSGNFAGIDYSSSSGIATSTSGIIFTSGISTSTGGTITSVSGDWVHTFTSSSTFIPTGSGNIQYLVVGGGGGGGRDIGGGGGAGGFRTNVTGAPSGGGASAENAAPVVTAASYAITVGAGGAGSTVTSNPGTNGSDSSIVGTGLNIVALGGGGGRSRSSSVSTGGSGGGGAYSATGAGSGTANQGYNGGAGVASGGAGGGGGAGQQGAAASGTNAGNGGNGVQSSITGSAVYYAGGGGGGSFNATEGVGGSGGGGSGGSTPTAGTANTGGGGGGQNSFASGSGAAGGSGIVIVRYTPGFNNMVLVSQAFSASTSPAVAKFMFAAKSSESFTLDTDITAAVSRDGGTSWATTTLVALSNLEDGTTLYGDTAVDLSSQPTGTSMKYRIFTFNSKPINIYGIALQWGETSAQSAGTLSVTGSLSAQSLSLTSALGVAAGGTGWSNLEAGRLLFGNGTGALATSSNLFWDTAGNRLTLPHASTTALTVSGTASTTNLIVSSAGGSTGCAQFNSSGLLSNTGTACGTGSGGADFTFQNHFGALTAATSSPVLFTGNLFASSTVRFGNAGVNNFLFDGTSGKLGVGTSTPFGSLSIHSTAGVPQFVIGSSTTQFIVDQNGNVGIGTSSPSSLFSIQNVANFKTGTSTIYNDLNVQGLFKVGTNSILLNGNGTSTFSGGIDLSTGCFAILGTCLLSGGSGLTAGDVNASVNNFVNAMQIASSSAKYVYLVDGVADSFGSASTANFSGIDQSGSGNIATSTNGSVIQGGYSATMNTVFLTSGTSWSVPVDWSSASNTVETIGGGGAGAYNTGSGGGGGGGGAYAKSINITLSPGGSVAYAIGAGGAGNASGAGGTGGDTYFCNSTSNCASIGGSAVVAGAKGGTGGNGNTPGTGGASGSSIGSVKYSGGNGGTGANYGGAGGGGAAGPRGAGGTGGNTGTTDGGGGGGGNGGGTNGSNGGASDGGNGGNNADGAGSGAGGTAGTPTGSAGTAGGGGGGGRGSASPPGSGGAGGAGTEWDASHGSGGGGGASGDQPGTSFSSATAGSGGLYGGGGAGTGADPNSGAGSGAQGLIVIRYNTVGTDFTLRSAAFSASTSPVVAKLLFAATASTTFTLNTDIAAAVSRDGGTSWATTTLVALSNLEDGTTLYGDTAVDLSSQPTGTSMKYRIITTNNKSFRIHGVALQWGSVAAQNAGSLSVTGSLSAQSLSLTSALGVAAGGTGWSNLEAGRILFGNGTGSLATSSDLYWNNATSHLGIGTSSPASKLSVFGDIFAEGSDRYLNFGSATGTNGYGIRDNAGTIEFKNSAGSWTGIGAGASLTGTQGQTAYFSGTNTAVGTSSLFIATNGNVGVGSTSPMSALTVAGQMRQYVNDVLITDSPTINGSMIGLSVRGQGLELAGIQTNTSGAVKMGAFRATYFPTFWSNNAEVARFSLAGNLGIGTTSPSSKLSVYGDAFFEGSSRYLNFGTATGTNGYGFRDNGGTLEFKNSGGSWNQLTMATTGPAFSVHKGGTNQTISAATYTLLTWSNETFDTNNNFDLSTERFTPTVPGKYLLTVSAYCSDSTASCVAYISKNGSISTSYISGGNSSGGNQSSAATILLDMNGSTDYVEAYVTNYSGTTIDGTAIYTNFSGTMIAPIAQTAGGWTNDGTSSYLIDTTDRVGIGTTTPWSKLALNGDLFMEGTSRYINFGTTATGTGGYGIRDNAGTLEFKNSGGSWTGFGTGSGGSGGGQLLATYATSSVGTTTVNFNGTAGSAPSFSGATLTLPSNTSYIVVETWGGGGGGSGGGAGAATHGTAGGTTCFGTNATACASPAVSATGGSGGLYVGAGGAGGAGSGGDINITGGGGGGLAAGAFYIAGGSGGSAPRGGGAGTSYHAGAGGAGAAMGGGGAGGSINPGSDATYRSGSGGGGGGYAQKIVSSLASTYYFTVGTGGAGGNAGTSGTAGGAGGAGGVVISIYTTGVSQGAIGGGAAGYLPYYTDNTASTSLSATSTLFLSTAGKFGVGTTTPWGKLSINSTAGIPQFVIGSSTTQFIVDANGNVGIGTTSPSQKLYISDSFNTSVEIADTTNNARLRLGTLDTLTYLESFSNHDLSLGTNDSPVMRLTTGGNVGIGTTSPTAKLTITTGSQTPSSSGDAVNGMLISAGSGSASLNIGIRDTGVSGTQYGWLQTAYTNSAAATGYLALNPNGGNVGIGTTSPMGALAINGNAFASSFNTATNGTSYQADRIMFPSSVANYYVLNQNSVGVVLPNGNTSWSAQSDERLKTNITGLDSGSSLDAILALNPVSFNWKNPGASTSTQLGFIAQEVGAIFPQLITRGATSTETPDGTLYLNYEGLISPMVRAIQELKSQLDERTSRLLVATSTDIAPLSATTSVAEMIAATSSQSFATSTASTTAATSTPWVAAFVDMSEEFRYRMNDFAEEIVHVLGKAVYASVGFFEEIFAKTIRAENVYADTVNANKLCLEDICVTKEELQLLLSNSEAMPATQPDPEPDLATSTPPTTPEDESVTETPPADEPQAAPEEPIESPAEEVPTPVEEPVNTDENLSEIPQESAPSPGA